MGVNSATDPAGVISRPWMSGVFWNEYDDEPDVLPGHEADEDDWYAADGGLWPYLLDRESGEANDD